MIKAREKNIARELSEIIQENKHAGYVPAVKELSMHYGVDDIAAAAIFSAYGEMKRATREGTF